MSSGRKGVAMNMYTKMIMDLLGLEAKTALQVQDAMQIDFSECTRREFNREARLAYAALIFTKLYN